jgi:alanine racemase
MSERSMIGGALLTVDLAALCANYDHIRRAVAPAEAGAVVKADAYGLGAAQVAPALAAQGCRRFFVAHLSEALELQPLLPESARLYVLNGLPPGAEAACAAAGVRPVLNSLEQAMRWRGVAAARPSPSPAALQIDSGMSRLGLSEAETRALAGDPDFFRLVEVELLMSHFACADAPGSPANAAQRDRFEALAALLPPLPRSLANSAASLGAACFHGDVARPGLALYGASPFAGAPSPMRPVVRLQAPVLQLRTIPAGAGVGYGLTFHAQTPRRIATIGLGYADGWPRRLGGVGSAFVGDVRVPVVGRISMDSLALDVTAVAPDALHEGDLVEFIGPHQSLEDVARDADTLAYEILTGLGHRFERRYLAALSPSASLARSA